METKQFVSSDGKDLIIKIRAPLDVLKEKAAEVEYKMLLDEKECEEYAETTDSRREKGLNIAEGGDFSVRLPFRRFESLHVPFAMHVDQRLYVHRVFPAVKRREGAHPFIAMHRLKLMKMIFEGKSADDCGIDLERSAPSRNADEQVVKPFIKSHFPLHNIVEAEELRRNWLSWSVMPWKQPNNDIREYFGEHIALYYKFLAYYTTCLGIPSIVGIGASIHVLVQAPIDYSVYKSLETVKIIPAFCVIISIWSLVLLDYWKQSEAMQAFRWGMDEFEETEENRKGYSGKEGPSFVDGKMTKHFPVAQKQWKLQISVMVTVFMMTIAIGCVAGVFALKSYLLETVKLKSGEVLANFVNIFQVTVLRASYDVISKQLNEQENCKTDTEYEDSMIIKLFAFNSVNAYAAVFYIAFVKEAVGDGCIENSCVGELGQTLLIVFGSQLFLSPFTQLIIPLFSRWCCSNSCSSTNKSAFSKRSEIEDQALRKQYLPRDAIDDYSTLAIAFGYMTLFVAAVPFAPLLAFFSSFFELRIDGVKMLSEFSRPMPTGREDIGMWHEVFKSISYAGVFTNAAIVFYTGKYFPDLTGSARLAWAAVSCVIIFALRALVSNIIPLCGETAVGLDVQKERQEYVRRRMVFKSKDDGGRLARISAGLDLSKERVSPNNEEEFDNENAYEASIKEV